MAWRFLIFTGIMVLLFYAHFYLAHRQWHANRGSQTTDIDRGFVLREQYFAESFRAIVRAWKELPGWQAHTDGTRTLHKGNEVLRATASLTLPADARSDDVLLVDGDLHVGHNSVLSHEVYATGDAHLGRACQFQAIASDGDLSLGEESRVARWIDSGRCLRLGAGCAIHSRATARNVVEVNTGARARSIYAPEIRVLPTSTPGQDTAPVVAARELFTPDNAVELRKLGVEPAKLEQLAPNCWVYRDSLTLQCPVAIEVTLIVKGDCRLAPASTTAADLKAEGRLHIGRHCQCRANLIAGDSICMDEFSVFAGVMHADSNILLGRGVRGGTDERLVAAYAGARLYTEEDVVIKGKLSAGDQVHAVPASFAGAWRREHGFAA